MVHDAGCQIARKRYRLVPFTCNLESCSVYVECRKRYMMQGARLHVNGTVWDRLRASRIFNTPVFATFVATADHSSARRRGPPTALVKRNEGSSRAPRLQGGSPSHCGRDSGRLHGGSEDHRAEGVHGPGLLAARPSTSGEDGASHRDLEHLGRARHRRPKDSPTT